jgi:hypothetical protein
MAQDLNAIISELDAAYNPSRQTINDRINGLQGAESADIAGLEGQKVQAFDDITNGARSKGMGFSGIPIQEQAKYTASSFLPAVAKVKQSYNDGRNSLVDALNNMNIDQRKTAMSIRETQQNRDFESQQAALTRQAQERASSAANASSGALNSLFSGGGAAALQTQQKAAADPNGAVKQKAASEVVNVLKNNNVGQLTRYWAAISQSAKNGNPTDALKVQAIQAMAPGLFKGGTLNTNYLANAAKQGVKLF